MWEVVGLGTEKYSQDKGENLYRRTIYNFWKRMAPSPNMETFNAPNREVSCVRRDRTNTPLQALVTLNDPQFVEAARSLASTRSPPRAPIAMPPCATSPPASSAANSGPRNPPSSSPAWRTSPPTTKPTLPMPKPSSKSANPKPDPALDPTALAAWTMLCNQMMNLDEVLNK
nr:DUF1553 domain-containing protein [Verrucomicrobium spinosum]